MEWQEAREWMLQAKAFPQGHPGVRPNAGLDDFAKCLRDGVFLCELLNKIVPDAVQHYHRKAGLEVRPRKLSGSLGKEQSSMNSRMICGWSCFRFPSTRVGEFFSCREHCSCVLSVNYLFTVVQEIVGHGGTATVKEHAVLNVVQKVYSFLLVFFFLSHGHRSSNASKTSTLS